jgi:outer membrane protein OmpA-like peptidoglycan-associated protein
MENKCVINPGRLKRLARSPLSAALCATLALALHAGPAAAQTDGWYVGGEAGVNIVPHIRFDALANTWRQSQDPGYALAGQVGYGFGRIRLEGELGWRNNDLSKFNDASGDLPVGGSIGGVSFMGNAYYDFNTGTKLTPYLGVGIGGLDLSADHIAANSQQVTNDNKTVFAYQGIAGLSYALSDSLSLKTDYRYQRAEKANLTLNPSYSPNAGSGSYAAHMLMVGFTMKFPPAAAPMAAAAPMPPPPPAAVAAMPAPPPKAPIAAPIAKTYMLFFDFDKDVLTPEGKAIVTQAADAAKKNHSATIALTGYTDLSGTVPYNLKLSVRRGESVKKMMVQLGIPANEISVVGKGKSDPLVPTKDGVREPQNRRVQIVLE